MPPNDLALQFTVIFREEHRQVRDGLLELVDAFEERDAERAERTLRRVAELTGPHFRYEEESLYPALVELFGGEYVEKLLADHDGAIAGAARLAELVREPITSETKSEGVRIVRTILPHVSDCDGLSIMVEVLDRETTAGIFEARDRARQEGLDLLAWASTVRGRPSEVPEPVG